VSGKACGKRQWGQTSREQVQVLFSTAWLYSLINRGISGMLKLLIACRTGVISYAGAASVLLS
jgi:hypothetical protein